MGKGIRGLRSAGGRIAGLRFATAAALWQMALQAYGRWRDGDPRADWAWAEIVRLAEAARH